MVFLHESATLAPLQGDSWVSQAQNKWDVFSKELIETKIDMWKKTKSQISWYLIFISPFHLKRLKSHRNLTHVYNASMDKLNSHSKCDLHDSLLKHENKSNELPKLTSENSNFYHFIELTGVLLQWLNQSICYFGTSYKQMEENFAFNQRKIFSAVPWGKSYYNFIKDGTMAKGD